MGPQFSFKAYCSSAPVSPSNDPSSSSAAVCSSSAILHTPSPPNTIIYSSSFNSPNGVGSGVSQLVHASSNRTRVHSSPSRGSLDSTGSGRQASLGIKAEGVEQGEQDGALQSAVLFPSPDNPLLDLLSDAQEMQNLTIASLHPNSMPLSTLHVQTGKEDTVETGSYQDPGESKQTHIYVLLYMYVH